MSVRPAESDRPMRSRAATRKFLTMEQLEQFSSEGYCAPVSVFSEAEVVDLGRNLDRLLGLLEPGELSYSICCWEQSNDWLYSLINEPRILDCVEDVLGRDVYQWSSNMMCKTPHEGRHVPWHQDGYDWPLRPHDLVTVWVAFGDADDENGCLRVMPGSHRHGLQRHIEGPAPLRNGTPAIFPFYLDPAAIDEKKAVSVPLKSGQISIHHALTWHYSEANSSDRRRNAFTICYAATRVKCVNPVKTTNGDWTDFTGYLCRGVDGYRHFRHLDAPKAFGRNPRNQYR